METNGRKFISRDPDSIAESRDWIDSLEDVLYMKGPSRVEEILAELQIHAQNAGVNLPCTSETPYTNTIPAHKTPKYPGSREIERRIKSIIRWNAMAMVVRANRQNDGIGGHISTFASSATLYEVGFNHFFKGPDRDGGDLVYFQGHASPGIYARAYLEGRLTEHHLENFRRDLAPGGGLSSYPHPWLMPDFWQFPTVSMGLGPICAIYQAGFLRHLEHRGILPETDRTVWAFLGDGECDEPEALGAINLAARRQIDNLVFVINCNLQRLDGPVRGNGKVIQELEAIFRGAGWNVLKVIWGCSWDPLLAADDDGLLVARLGEVVDGEYQKFNFEGGAYIRNKFFGVDDRLLKMVEHLSDNDIWHLRRGGHDPEKVYAAYKAAVEHKGSPTVILAKTIKGYGLGEAGEGRNITHQQKKLNEEELLHFRDRFDIPISNADISKAPFYRPPADSIEMQYLHERRRALGGYLPKRTAVSMPFKQPDDRTYDEFNEGTGDRELSTTMAFVRLLSKLLRDKSIGERIVPIVPDEARTFGMETLFRQCGIYSPVGQVYDPVDSNSMLYYKEARDGQILEEGITEAGSLASFIAAGTSYSVHGEAMIPFFIYYSMFGFQRVGDLIWAAGDSRTRGFLLGATAGRTTLNGEGLQHQDGHSHVIASSVPNCLSYDPAFAFEVAAIVKEGLRRMTKEEEDIFYYITLHNENYPQPPSLENVEKGILKGLYRFETSTLKQPKARVQILGSGPLINAAFEAKNLLENKFDIAADVWSVTSYNELHRDAMNCERWNMLHPGEKPQVPYIQKAFSTVDKPSIFVSVSDYMKSLSDKLARWVPGELISLGTDGYGRSESREALRDFFEVDARYVALAALTNLAKDGTVKPATLKKAIKEFEINPEKLNPMTS